MTPARCRKVKGKGYPAPIFAQERTMYYVYVIVEEKTGKKYIGFSSDLRKRIAEHNNRRGAKYTEGGKWNLVYYEAFTSKKDAIMRERRLKHDGRAKYHLFQRIGDSLAGQK